jgi:hypothetical protein
MTLFAWTLILAVLLSGVVAGVFVLLVIGIHAGDRARHLGDQPGTRLDALTRRALGVGVRTGRPAANSRAETEWPADTRDRSDNPCR